MISVDGKPKKMNIMRKTNIAEQEEILVGKEEIAVLKGSEIMCNVISSMLFGSKPHINS